MRWLARAAHVANKFPENVGSALDSLAAAKGRSGLTILGVVIGVSTVMAMATIVSGIRDQIMATIEIAGPTTVVNPAVVPYYRDDARHRVSRYAGRWPGSPAADLRVSNNIWCEPSAHTKYPGFVRTA